MLRRQGRQRREGRDNAPIYANLFDDEGGEGYTLLWSRPRKDGDLDPGPPKMLVPRLAPGAWDTWTCLWLISRWQLCPALACWCALLARTLLGIRFRNSSGSTSSLSARRPMTFMLT